MHLIKVFGTATFRTVAVISAGFALTTVLLFGFIFWQTTGYERARMDQFLRHEAAAMLREPAADVINDVDSRYAADLHRQSFAAVFSADHRTLGGSLESFPAGLAADGRVHRLGIVRQGDAGTSAEAARVLATTLADGRVVIVGRSDADLVELRRVVERALVMGLGPGMALALLAGIFASLRVLARVARMNQAIGRIMAGALSERLPTHRGCDEIDQLAASVNRMLGEISRLLAEVQGVGDDIAHELRTPLARARSRLEGGRARAATRDDLVDVVDRAIGDLDQTFSTITALLRIRQIETSHRRTNFAQTSLTAIVREAEDLYAPIAELRGIALRTRAEHEVAVYGDRDLLFEAVANLLDNAIKFAPGGGWVELAVLADGPVPTIRLSDNGPGIPPGEREAVKRRFYRSARNRELPGVGLGLSLVAAILHLHGFRLAMQDRDGMFCVNLICG